MCSVSCKSVGIKIDLSFAGSKVQGMTCLSLQVFFWQVGRVAEFPSWLLKSRVREPEGGKAAAAKPSPFCFHLRDIPLRVNDSYIVKLLSKLPTSVIAHKSMAKAFPCPVHLHSKTVQHANSTAGSRLGSVAKGAPCPALWQGAVIAPAELSTSSSYPHHPHLSGNLNLQLTNTPWWMKVVSFPSTLKDV